MRALPASSKSTDQARATAALAFALALVSVAAAQRGSPAQGPVFHAAVDLVQVHAVATDGHGDAVKGLAQTDFQIFDRGLPQQVATFAEIAHERAARPAFPPLLARDVGDNTLAAQGGRVVVVLVDDLHTAVPIHVVTGLVREIVHEIAPPVTIALASTSGRLGVEPTEDLALIERALASYHIIGPFERAMTLGSKLVAMADALAGDDRLRKACVVITSARDDTDGVATAGGSAVRDLQRANLATYVLDPAFDGAFAPLASLAERTGGFAVGADALDDGLARLFDDLDHYYLLGFYPGDAPDGRSHELSVRVTRPGVDLRARADYVRGGGAKRSKGDTLLMDLAWNPLPVTTLPLQVFAMPFFDGSGASQIAVALQVSANASPSEASTFIDHVGVGLMTIPAGQLKANKKVEHQADVSVAIDPAARADDGQYLVLTTLPLDPGRYQLRVSATSKTADKAGSVYLMIDVPGLPADEPALGGAMLGLDGRAGVPVGDQQSLSGITLPFVPALAREFPPGETLRVFVPIGRRRPRAVSGTIGILDAANRLVRSEPWSVDASAPGVDARLPLSGLAPGAYRVFVSMTSETPTGRTERQVGFTITAAGSSF
jgi:VWFA-related protein